MPRILVVGAGMAGLTAARRLVDAGHDVVIVEKGRAVGGRMATRRVGDATFDHGAQHISARSEDFRKAMTSWIDQGIAHVWFHSASETRADRAIEPRHTGTAGMRRIPERLADGLDVRTAVRIESLRRQDRGWVAVDDSGDSFDADAVVLTPPLPQALDLLDGAGVAVEDRLREVAYDACLAVMATLRRAPGLPDGHRALDGDIGWMADNQHKGASAVPAVTIHSSPAFAEQHLETSAEVWAPMLVEAAEPHLGELPHVVRTHRWRYAMPATTFADGAITVDDGLILAGEVFAGARVEGAYLSGLAAADLVVR